MTEAQIQRAVFAHLAQRRAPRVYAMHVPNGGYRRRVEAAMLKSMGVRRGAPDVFCIARGAAYAIELKAEGGRVTEDQWRAIDDIRAAGGHAVVCYGLDAALKQLEEWGILRC